MRTDEVNPLTKRRISTSLLLAIITVFTVITIFPFWVMLTMATYSSEQIYTGVKFWFGDYLSQNYLSIARLEFHRFFINSLIISLSAATLGSVVCAMTGYGLGKFHFRGKKVFVTIIVSTLMIPYQITLIGNLIEMRWLGINNTYLPMIIPFIAIPFGAFWMYKFVGDAVPSEILESLRIDGCGEFRIFIGHVTILIRSALISVFMIIFMWSWNNYLIPLIFVNDQRRFPITLAINMLTTQYRTDIGAQIFALAIATIPVILMMIVGSKYLIKGLTAGSIKG